MSKIATTCLTLLAPFYLLSTSIYSIENAPNPSTIQAGPQLKAKFHSAEAIHILPKLQYLDANDPGFNKVLFTLEGYPKNKDISFEMKRLASKNPDVYQPIVVFSIMDDGTYLTKTQPPQRLNAIIASSHGFLPGERVTYRFRTLDGTVDKEISGIPAPASFKDDHGKVVVRAEMVSVSPTVYTIDFPQMKEGEEYELKATTLGETVTAKPKYTKSKPFHYSPSAGKSAGGEAIVEIKVKSGDVYSLKLPWGTALEAHLKGKKPHLYH